MTDYNKDKMANLVKAYEISCDKAQWSLVQFWTDPKRFAQQWDNAEAHSRDANRAFRRIEKYKAACEI